jgi:exopolysaccharide production protein ExoY
MPHNISHSVLDQDWQSDIGDAEQSFLLRDLSPGQAEEPHLFDEFNNADRPLQRSIFTASIANPSDTEITLQTPRDELRELARSQAIVKRAFDISASILAIFLLAPIWLAIISILALQKGPILFVQDRIGMGGQIFRCYKFRTMIIGADAMLAKVLACDPDKRAEWNAHCKLARDPRITAFGKVLRLTSLDELPQLLNVLKGDMSFVGPRPIVRSELSKYRGFYRYYLSVRPGLTGLWQVNGRNSTTYHRRVALDVAYVNKFSLALDAKIIALTLPALFRTDEIS